MIEETRIPHLRLGRLPAKASPKALQFSNFFNYMEIPTETKKQTPIPLRHYGNLEWGNCTIAKQINAQIRMERLEQKHTIDVTDQEAIRVYQALSLRLYGGGDNGAYEDDALSNWRNPETTFRDTKGRAYPIDAYLRINPHNHDEMRAAIAFAAARGIAVCFNLPIAYIGEKGTWDIPKGQALIGDWIPGSWGGHSSWCTGYNEIGPYGDHTWAWEPWQMTWASAAVYLDEAHVVIDSVNAWRKQRSSVGTLPMSKVIEAVNDVSSIKIRQPKPGEKDVYGDT
jgi:hypothetical protein